MMKGLKNCNRCNGRGYRIINSMVETCGCIETGKKMVGRLVNIDSEIAYLYGCNPRLPEWVVESKRAGLEAEAEKIRSYLPL